MEDEKSEEQLLREAENAGIERLVAALEREGRFTTRDAIVRSAGLNLSKGRAYLDIALSRGRIVDVGKPRKPVFVRSEDAAGVLQEVESGGLNRLRGGGVPPPPYPPRTDGRETRRRPCRPNRLRRKGRLGRNRRD